MNKCCQELWSLYEDSRNTNRLWSSWNRNCMIFLFINQPNFTMKWTISQDIWEKSQWPFPQVKRFGKLPLSKLRFLNWKLIIEIIKVILDSSFFEIFRDIEVFRDFYKSFKWWKSLISNILLHSCSNHVERKLKNHLWSSCFLLHRTLRQIFFRSFFKIFRKVFL